MAFKYKRVYLTEKNNQVIAIAPVENATMSGISAYNHDKKIAIVPLQGHVLINESAAKYAEEFNRFEETSLDKFPKRLRLIPNPNLSAKYKNAIEHLKEAEEIVIATDFDNEGAAIALNIIEKAGAKDRVVFMLEMGSTHPDELRHAIDNPTNIPYENMAEAGRMRAWIDFLEGMYLSRALSIYLGNNYAVKLNYGGVKAPLTYIVVERDFALENHKKVYFWVIKGFAEINGKRFPIQLKNLVEEVDKKGNIKKVWSEKFETEKQAREVCKDLIDKDIEVSTFKKSIKKSVPPKLFELTGLQAEMGMLPLESMAVAQKNYDNPVSIQSYPRTETPYLKSAEYSDVKSILKRLKDHNIIDSNIIDNILSGSIPKRNSTFNDSEVTAHGAIIPTKSGDYKKWLDSLPSDNTKMFKIISKRYVANFMKDYAYSNISGESVIINDNIKIVFSENIPIEAGWKAIYDNKISETISNYKPIIPEIKKGDFINIVSLSENKSETKPKPPFTIDSLLLAMKNISSLFPDNPEIKKYLGESGIGTSATRSKIIDEVMNVEKNGGEPWIVQVAKKIKSTDKAKNFVRSLPPELVSPIKRALLNKKLKDIERGVLDYDSLAEEYLIETKKNIELIKKIVKDHGFIKGAEKGKVSNLKVVGKCPMCEGNLVEKKKIFDCTNAKYKKNADGSYSNDGCSYMIFKGGLTKLGKLNITASEVTKMLKNGTVKVALKSKKSGSIYNKDMIVDKKWGVKINF